ncbi:hypothetical protein J437_LFUL007897 [Ladona fulva]|uniref:Mos1 transposase HTH domain-containing protein n=1 Tax=Ladona fulva TaxID=123851 RepID=A0A8K0K8J5_LADFU|nr:hypothetical protein J437_LFUL007897 [Ladona fulva]
MPHIECLVVIKFLTAEGRKPSEIHGRLRNVFKNASPSYSTVKRWAKLFEFERSFLDDEPQLKRPPEATTEEKITLVKGENLSDRRLTTKVIASRLGSSQATAPRISEEHLFTKKIKR